MSEELQLLATAALAATLALALIPAATRLALATGFLDHPVSYKAHGRSTPYLGGLAVIVATCVATLVFSDALGDYAALFWGMLGLCVLGTLDDRVALPVPPRFVGQVAAATLLYVAGYHWELGLGAAPDFAFSVLWVVGVVNAFNLMDNLDGATGSVTGAAAGGAGILAATQGQWELATLMIALGAASLAFLAFNLQEPSRIFLGDGGSTPIGFLIAAAAMVLPTGGLGVAALPACIPIAGLVILDTTLVVISRRRRGKPVLSGARDHLTHRLLRRLRTPRRVAAALFAAQAALIFLAYGLHRTGEVEVWVLAVLYSALGLTAIALLETPEWRSLQMHEQAQADGEQERRRVRSTPALESAS